MSEPTEPDAAPFGDMVAPGLRALIAAINPSSTVLYCDGLRGRPWSRCHVVVRDPRSLVLVQPNSARSSC